MVDDPAIAERAKLCHHSNHRYVEWRYLRNRSGLVATIRVARMKSENTDEAKRKDIAGRSDIERLVDAFYKRVQGDSLLAARFIHINWPEHLTVMYNFWSSMIFGEQSYRGNTVQKHVNLPLTTQHFDAWLRLFFETVDELFAGDRANEIKMRAQGITTVFKHKMNLAGKTGTS